ncbi:MAG: hypothetical protein ACRDJW_02610 [Thermomicrobiales bacterium]
MRTGEAPKITVSEEVIVQALRDYDRERISLGRLAELLDLDRATAVEFVESRGLRVRWWPETVEEAQQDILAAEKIR